MTRPLRRLDLRSLRFDATDEAWLDLPVLVEPFVFGGAEYVVRDGAAQLRLTAARVGARVTLHGEVGADVAGPCTRCLGEAVVHVRGFGREVLSHGESEGDEDDEAYATAGQLDLERWVRDLIAEALPERLLCREDCRGLCPDCGADLNLAGVDHRHEPARPPASHEDEVG
jgi:uncharacterized protein